MKDWYMSGPEEGDQCDTTILICTDDGTEVLELKSGDADIGRRIAILLNRAGAELIR